MARNSVHVVGIGTTRPELVTDALYPWVGSDEVTAAESAPTTQGHGWAVEGHGRLLVGLGDLTNVTDYDIAAYVTDGVHWFLARFSDDTTVEVAAITTARSLTLDVAGWTRAAVIVSAITTGGSPSIDRRHKFLRPL